MKGLLLKDFYILGKTFRYYFVLVLFFAVMSIWSDNLFMLAYPCVLFGTMTYSLQNMDERCHWDAFAATLPCSRRLQVGEKFLMGILLQFFGALMTVVAKGVTLLVVGAWDGMLLLGIFCIACAVGTTVGALSAFSLFWLGVDRARLVTPFLMGVSFAGCALVFGVIRQTMEVGVLEVVALLLSLLLYYGSWRLSGKLYEKKEIN